MNARSVETDPADINANVVSVFSGYTARSVTGGYLLLTAARYDEQSYGYRSSYGVFTRFLLEGSGYDEEAGTALADMAADTDGNGSVTLGESYVYTYPAVYDFIAQRSSVLRQHVQVWPENSGDVTWARPGITSGDGQVWNGGADGPAFGTNIPLEQAAGACVDGAALSDACYEIAADDSGLAVLTLRPEYLLTLAAGEHTLYALTEDGRSVNTVSFSVGYIITDFDEVFVRGDGAALSFAANGPCEGLTRVLVDGAELSAGDYEAAENADGTVTVLLMPEYPEGLDIATHTLTMFFGEQEVVNPAEFRCLARITAGDGQCLSIGSRVGAAFEANGPADRLRAVMVDGVILDSRRYTVSRSGSGVKVTLTPAALKHLGVGSHSLVMVFGDEWLETANEARFVIGKKIPRTGDASPIALMALMAGLAMGGLVLVRKKSAI